ncbi:hypothetical protein HGRIS_003708 [Hohenbuehelia grisea]
MFAPPSLDIPAVSLEKTPARPQPQIPRAELGPRVDSRVVQQHAPTEIVSSLSFLPKSNGLLLAGISHRWLRLFDLRTPMPSTSNVACKVQGITTDPFDPHRFGSFGDGVVSLWDHRKLVHPLLTFTEKDAQADGARIRPGSAYACVEFSGTRRGVLATMERDATYVRFWDFMEQQVTGSKEAVESVQSRDSSLSGRATRKPWANLPWTAVPAIPQSYVPSKEADQQGLLAYGTRRTRDFPKALASFALIPNSESHPLSSGVMVTSREGDLKAYMVHDTPKTTVWSSRGELAISTSTSFRLIPGIDSDPLPLEPWDVVSVDPLQRDQSKGSRSRSRPRIEGPIFRGRSLPKVDEPNREGSSSPAFFGRGDEEGFPALSPRLVSTLPPILPESKIGRPRNHSPTPSRNHSLQFEQASGPKPEGVTPKIRPVHQPRGRSGSRPGQESLSRLRKQRPLQAFSHVLEEDVSMIMRARVIQGYGMNKPHLNAMITKEESDGLLTETWAWIHHSREILCNPTPRLQGYDFSYEGLLGIWEGLRPLPVPPNATPANADQYNLDSSDTIPSSEKPVRSKSDDARRKFNAALKELAARRGVNKSQWKPTITTGKQLQRQLALELCGWSWKEEDFDASIKRWESDENYSRAACWLVFSRQYSKAVEVLMRSSDELHQIMSGTVTALSPNETNSHRNIELREHCERLILRIEDMYLRAMLTYLSTNDWTEVLSDETLPFRERLAIAFQFLEDKELSSYLRRCIQRSSVRGHIDALFVSGLTKPGFDILQGYVDHTGDVQTAAIMACHVCPVKFPDVRAERWLNAYRDMLDGFKLFHHRVNFDIERGRILQEAVKLGDIPQIEFVPRQILIRCNFCSKIINKQNTLGIHKGRACPHCNRQLPRCSICLMTLSIVQDGQRAADLSHPPHKDTIDDAIVMCQSCRHGGHASHILEWFFGDNGNLAHGVCAVTDCKCRCADEM